MLNRGPLTAMLEAAQPADFSAALFDLIIEVRALRAECDHHRQTIDWLANGLTRIDRWVGVAQAHAERLSDPIVH